MSFAGSFFQAMFVMFVVGLSRGMVHPGASKAIMDWFPTRERATAMGIKQSGYPVAAYSWGSAAGTRLALGCVMQLPLVGVIIISGGIITSRCTEIRKEKWRPPDVDQHARGLGSWCEKGGSGR